MIEPMDEQGEETPERGRRSFGPARIGPFAKPDPDAPPGQVGKRPSPPANLFVVGLAWVVCGIGAFFVLHASWKIVPGVVFIGIGVLFLRGALTAVVRHDRRRGPD
jgi:hypothetical protein